MFCVWVDEMCRVFAAEDFMTLKAFGHGWKISDVLVVERCMLRKCLAAHLLSQHVKGQPKSLMIVQTQSYMSVAVGSNPPHTIGQAANH